MNLPSRISDQQLTDLPVDGGLDALLVELRDHARSEARPAPARRPWGVVGATVVAVAALVAVVVVLPALLADQEPRTGEPVPGAPGTTAPQPSTTPAPTPSATAATAAPTPREPVERPWRPPSDLLVLDAPGWTVLADEVASTRTSVSVGYADGDRRFELEWTTTRYWQEQRDSAAREQPFAPLEVLGTTGDYVAYDSQQQMVYLPPVDGYGLRVSGTFTTPDEFRGLLDRLRRSDTLGLPTSIVGPDEVDDAVTAAVARTETPDGFTPPSLVGWNSPYGVAAAVVPAVGCAWARQYVDGDRDQRAAARTALERSPRWPLLNDPVVDYPDWLVDTIVDRIRAGAPDEQVLSVEQC